MASNSNLTAAALKDRLADLLEVTRKEADNILWAIQEVCTETVKKGGTLTLPGVGKVECSVRPARKARNPRTGESVRVPAKVAVKIKAVKSLKESAPSLNTKQGKALLEAAEERQAERDKRRRKKEREAEREESGRKSSKGSKSKNKKSKSKKASRY